MVVDKSTHKQRLKSNFKTVHLFIKPTLCLTKNGQQQALLIYLAQNLSGIFLILSKNHLFL